ncbi:hypothetical protein P5673_013196, partial [Acropora cervicornis]
GRRQIDSESEHCVLEKYFKDDFAEQPEGTRASEQLERKVSLSIERF